MGGFSLGSFVDAARYPLHRPGGAEYAAVLRRARAMLAADGCAVLPGVVCADGVRALAAEADVAAPFAWRSFNCTLHPAVDFSGYSPFPQK